MGELEAALGQLSDARDNCNIQVTYLAVLHGGILSRVAARPVSLLGYPCRCNTNKYVSH
jgi:hypothetical protein